MKTKKIGLSVLAVAAGLVGAWWIYSKSKKTYKELERREEENREILKKSGLTDEQVDQLMVEAQEEEKNNGSESLGQDYDLNMCEKLFEAVRFKSVEIPSENVSVDEILDNDTEHVIHVVQRFDKRNSRDVLDFLFEIPTSALIDSRDGGRSKRKSSDGNTCVQDFARAIKGIFDHEKGELVDRGYVGEMESIAKDEENLGFKVKGGKFFVESMIEGYYYVRFEEKDEDTDKWYERSAMIRIDRSMYENNPWNEDHTRVTDYVYDLRQAYSEKDATYVELPVDSERVRNVEVVDAIAVVRVTFNIQGGKHLDGINITSGLKILENIWNEFEVHKDHGTRNENEKDLFTYDYFLFYNPRPDGDRLEVFDTEEREDGKYAVVRRDFV